MNNKIKFGLRNVHYAEITESEGSITYGTPVRFPGAVELTLEPRGDLIEFYADDLLYYSADNNQGYEGTLVTALIPEHFSKNVLGERESDDGVIYETSNNKGKRFALMFEFDGDVKATRHVLYSCAATRPTTGGETKDDSPEPQTEELSFVAAAREGDYLIKSRTSSNTESSVYNSWYTSVYEPNTDNGNDNGDDNGVEE